MGGEERSVKAGESITIPANTPHHFWNDGEEEAHSIQSFRPALKIDRFFESYFGLAHDGKLNEEGLPSFWQMAVLVPYFGDEIRTPNPPWALQRAVFGLLAPVGRMLGYRPDYPYPYGERGGEPSVSEGERGVSANSGARTGAVVVMGISVALFLVSFLLRHRIRRSRR